MGVSTLNSVRSESSVTRELLKAATPNLYRVNAFRITGLRVNVRPRDIARHFQKLEMLAKLGTTDGQSGPLALDPPPDADAFREAKQRLNDPQRRLIDEFFWFWPDELGEGRNDQVLAVLDRGDLRAAAQTWMQGEKNHSESNVSMHNLAVLSHVWALDSEQTALHRTLSDDEKKLRDDHWRLAYKRWRTLLDHAGFWNRLSARIRELDDPRLTAESAQDLRGSLPLALLSINADLGVEAAEQGDAAEAKRQLEVMAASEMDQAVANEALRRAAQPVRDQISMLCRAAEPEAGRDSVHGDQVVQRLVHDATPLLAVLDTVLQAGHATRDGAHDQVANTGLGCQIAYANKTENWKVSIQILETLLAIAASQSTRSRIEENLKIVKANDEIAEANKVFGTCFFCGENRPDINHPATVPMHGNVQTLRVGYNRTRTTWNHNTLNVPRCSVCARAHRRVASVRSVGRVLAFVSIIAYLSSVGWWGEYLYGQHAAGWYKLLWVVASFIFPLYLWRAAGRVLLKGRAAEEKKYEFGTVQERRKQGWKCGLSPSATHNVPKYRLGRGKWLGDWQPFRRWMERKQPVFISLLALWLPILLILCLIPFLWGWAVGTPASTRDLYRIGLLSKSAAARRFSAAAADESKTSLYRQQALKEFSAILPKGNLGAWPDNALDILDAELANSDSTLRRYAAVKLGDMGIEALAATPTLKAAINDTDASVQEAATQALSKISPDEAVSTLVANLKSNDSQVRQRAAALLRGIGPAARAATPMLWKSRRDPDVRVREMADLALQSIDPNGYAVRSRRVSASSYRTGNSSYHPHETLPAGTYRVPLSESLGLNMDSASIDVEKARLKELIVELNRSANEVNSERSTYNMLVNEVNQLAGQINLARPNLDRTSQSAVDNYNNMVRNYNSALQQLRFQQQTLNQAVEEYNAKLQQVKSQQQTVNQGVEEYNRKLRSVGTR